MHKLIIRSKLKKIIPIFFDFFLPMDIDDIFSLHPPEITSNSSRDSSLIVNFSILNHPIF